MALRPVLRSAELARSNGAFNEHIFQCVFRLAQRLLSLPFEGFLNLLLYGTFDGAGLGLINDTPRDQGVAANVDRVSLQPIPQLPFRTPRRDCLRIVAEGAELTDFGPGRAPVGVVAVGLRFDQGRPLAGPRTLHSVL